MQKFVIYTVIVGNYDSVKQPAIIDDRFDFVLFSDTVVDQSGVWDVRPIPYETDKRWLKARYPKLNPHILLPEYKAWLYIDGSVRITTEFVYQRCVELYNKGCEWGGVIHPWRDCIYDELNRVLLVQKVHDYEMLGWYCYLRKKGFPEHFGLFEAGLIFRSDTQNVKAVNETWWWSLVKFHLRRDQLSNMYAIWEVPDLRISEFFQAGQSVRDHDGFEHIKHLKPAANKVLSFSLWEKFRRKYVNRACRGESARSIKYTQWFERLRRVRFPRLAMHFWTAWIIVRYGPFFLAQKIRKQSAN